MKRVTLRLLPVVFTLAAGAFCSAPVGWADGAANVQVRAVVHGVRLTLAVPGTRYPKDALIRVTLTATNVSHSRRYVYTVVYVPTVTVLDGSGKEVYSTEAPLGSATIAAVPEPAPSSRMLLPGQSLTLRPYVVLRGRHIEANAMLGRLGRGLNRTVTTPPLTVALTQEPAPTATIDTSSGLAATITPSPPVAGWLIYYEDTICETPRAISLGAGPWRSTASNTIQPSFAGTDVVGQGCDGRAHWHAVAGWLNHPVVLIEYDDGAGD